MENAAGNQAEQQLRSYHARHLERQSFYQEQEFPAGHFAASILNISDDELRELIQSGGAPTFFLPVVIQGSEQEAAQVFPLLRLRIMYLTELIWQYPPFCYNDHKKKELESIFCLMTVPFLKYESRTRSISRSF